ncbi:hypothetical protein IC744_06790 [Microbacterium hominis]|uniref:hypothetical protein n=1 Tax=Microbacterium TaxID=33882 RepID=UPI00168B3243|nr:MULTISPECIES: hypothetical protein [Microbacterium]QOC26055.1 hypothetical protein IC745_01110 [Microbacterium hominis]QOC30026.1 hypothetical protein IC744_06790 [Microbacterium hominis]QYF98464.1 hypothetical protein KY498_04255 [Microbacterium sp. PAMC21962]
MSTATRKARKRAGVPFTKPAKTPTYAGADSNEHRGLGFTSRAEILAGILIRGTR